MKKLISLIMVAAIVIAGMVGYGAFWTWIKSTGHLEQNTVGIKPQEPPGALQVAAMAVPVTGAPTRLGIKNDAHLIKNPVSPTRASVLRGEERFKLSCSPCHGLDGTGSGIMGSVPRLAPAPEEEAADLASYLSGFMSFTPDINADFVLDLSDGELYWIITNGGEAIMPGYADALDERARWDLINYIRNGLGVNRGL